MNVYTIGLVVLLVAGLLCLENYRETHRFIVRHYSVTSHKLYKRKKPRTIVVLSDLHNQVYGDHNKELLAAIRKQCPDVILIAGDMLIGNTKRPYDKTAEFVSQLTKLCTVYYGNGNHEQRMKEDLAIYGERYQDYRSKLVDAGVIMLENKSYIRDWDMDLACVTGVEIPLKYYKKFNSHILTSGEVQDLVGKADPLEYQILIAHNPMHIKAYQEWGADLVVSGHLHGGLIALPFVGGVITPQAKLFPKYTGGKYQLGSTTLIVSRGLGNHSVKIRLFNPAEVVVLHVDGDR